MTEFSKVSVQRYCRLDPAMGAEWTDDPLREDVAREIQQRMGERFDRALWTPEPDAPPNGSTWTNQSTASSPALTLEDVERTFREVQTRRFLMPPPPPPEPFRWVMQHRFSGLDAVLRMPSMALAWGESPPSEGERRERLQQEYSEWRAERGLDPTLKQIDQFEEWSCTLAERDDMPLMAHGEDMNG